MCLICIQFVNSLICSGSGSAVLKQSSCQFQCPPVLPAAVRLFFPSKIIIQNITDLAPAAVLVEILINANSKCHQN